MNVKKIFSFSFFVFILCGLFAGCKTTNIRREDVSGVDYFKPTSIETADYAIRERIYALERQIADARSTVAELRVSCEYIRDVSRRSVSNVQEIIEQMEALVVWIDWATGYIQHLENILAAQVENTDMVSK
jgi:hypothetical protein